MNDHPEVSSLVLEDPLDQNAATRSRLYGLFVEVFTYPTERTMAGLTDGSRLEEITEVWRSSPIVMPAVPEPPAATGRGEAKDVPIVYTRMFEAGSGSPPVSLLERRYVSQTEHELWEHLLRFYSLFGLDFSNGRTPEQPDHLLTELAFMHYMSFLEAGAARGRDDLRRGQRDFLAHHLSCWLPPFAEALAVERECDPYGALARLLAGAVTADLQYLREISGAA
ncbi:MAG: molecular chaperone TorD family protein [Gammaproteobacteria bacterium]|nr:molecular chaperone TorD family protein [Gammaproteobacteria bacterium]